MRMRHGVPEIEINDDLNFSAIAHSGKHWNILANIDYRFYNALVEALLIKLGDSALYVLFGSYRKTEQTTASRSMLFSNAAGDPVCLQAESTTGARNKDEIDLLRSYISYTLQILLTGRGSISHILL